MIPENWELICSQMEEDRRKERKCLEGGKKRRGIFGEVRIELSENLLNRAKYVVETGKKIGWEDCNLSSFIRDAIIAYIFGIYDNDSLDDPNYDLSGERIIRDPLKLIQIIIRVYDGKPTKKKIIQFARKMHPNEFKHISDKTLENYISVARQDQPAKNTQTDFLHLHISQR